MSDKGSVFSKGGGGTNFEQYVQTAFLTTLIIRGNAPCLPPNEIIEVAFQSTSKGYQTDDLFVLAKSSIEEHRLLMQIKHNITISLESKLFKEVMKGFWTDYNNASLFNKSTDKLILIKSILTRLEKNNIVTVLNWAKTHSTSLAFLAEVNRESSKINVLKIFQKLLEEANDNSPLSDEEIWSFLRCLNILEYDFVSQGSIDETYFFNLIKLCKNNKTTANEKDIWGRIFLYVSKLNKDGGNAIYSTIPKEILNDFDTTKLSPYQKSLTKLISDGETILKPLKSTIKGFHIERNKIKQEIVDSINNFSFTIVTGKPGVGKSSIVKEILNNDFSLSSSFVFRADQFNKPTLSNVFSNQGVNESIQDIFSCISLIPEKIILIDSLEKLLEGDPENAFKQLLAIISEYSDIKIIGTARNYSIDLIVQKFGIPTDILSIIEINPLNDDELSLVSAQFPQLSEVLKNTKIKKLLESPKYLDFSITSLGMTSEDFSDISITEFKDKLWNSLVKNSTNRTNGLPAKREDAFLNIAINRAKEMKLFITPKNVDEEAIVALENDEIIFQEKQNRKYSPAHDILEDWALVKYISNIYEQYPNSKDLFNALGNEPAIRRAFRLWIEDYLIDDSKKVNTLIHTAITDSTIVRYWADEILVAVFKSDNCSSFFSAFKKELLAENASFLNRCLHLIRTSCKENFLTKEDISLLLPIGSGWKESISFVNSHITELDSIRYTIVNLIADWEYKFLFDSCEDSESLDVKNIIIHYINQVKNADKFWQSEYTKGQTLRLIKLIYNLSHLCQKEIGELIEEAFVNKESREYSKLNSFYEDVIKICLNGIDTRILAKVLPQIIVSSAWRNWKLKPRNMEELESQGYPFRSNYRNSEECWGIADKSSFFPSGVYKTPIYNLLSFHPMESLKFIVEFLNYCIDFYASVECEYKHKIEKIKIELEDGTIIEQWGAWELWGAYRGSSVTHYGIECILMTLEKYLLEVAEPKSEKSKKNLQYMFRYLLKNTNNVAITSVLASIAMAYPEEIEEEMIPILSVKEFFEWDLSRSIQEFSSGTMAMYDNEIYFAQKERHRLNQLPHRTKYHAGLRGFILDYQLNIKKINDKIFAAIDRMKEKADGKDIIWKKTLTDIDARNYRLGEYDENLGGFPVQAIYEKEVDEFINSNNDNHKEHQASVNYSSIVSRAYDGKEPIDIKTWNDCYKHFSNKNNTDTTFGRPITFAVLGLRDFENELNKKQTKWCLKMLVSSISSIIQDTYSRYRMGGSSYNIMEKEIALTSFHHIVKKITKENEKLELIKIMIYALASPFHEFEARKTTEYFRTTFYSKCPEEANRVWNGLISFAKYKKGNHYYHDNSTEAIEAQKKEIDFVNTLVSLNETNINFSEINFSVYEANILGTVFTITPYTSNESIHFDFLSHMLPLITEDLKIKIDYSYSNRNRGRQIHHDLKHSIELYLCEYLIYGNIEHSKIILDFLLNPIYSEDFNVERRSDSDLFNFGSGVLESLIYKLHKIIYNSKDVIRDDKLIHNFWLLWECFFDKIKSSKRAYFTSTLFLNIHWNDDSDHWKPLENKQEFYHKMVQELGTGNSKAIINVLSTVGDKTFLPEGLNWLTEHLNKNPLEITSLINSKSEQLIKRLFYNHISAIKNNKQLVDNYIWMLDNMVDLGSSQAYLFRENVITYKHT